VVLNASYCYVGIIVVLLCLENRLLFVPTTASAGWSNPPLGVPVMDVGLKSADGTRIHAWWSTPPRWRPSDGAVLFCHGNGGNLSHRGFFIAPLQSHLKTGVLLLDYPGYGRSEGSPTEQGCYAAADAAYDWLCENQHVPAEEIILYGGSLGGGVAAELASRRPHRALVLVSTFTSFPDQAQTLYPWLPARWLVRNQFNNLARLPSITGPVFITHGRQDTLVPFAMSERLFEQAHDPKQFFPMKIWGHGDVMQDEALTALQQFLKSHPSSPPS
jgi:pimeloyl-ACP methyl ester carboxylesterase